MLHFLVLNSVFKLSYLNCSSFPYCFYYVFILRETPAPIQCAVQASNKRRMLQRTRHRITDECAFLAFERALKMLCLHFSESNIPIYVATFCMLPKMSDPKGRSFCQWLAGRQGQIDHLLSLNSQTKEW